MFSKLTTALGLTAALTIVAAHTYGIGAHAESRVMAPKARPVFIEPDKHCDHIETFNMLFDGRTEHGNRDRPMTDADLSPIDFTFTFRHYHFAATQTGEVVCWVREQ